MPSADDATATTPLYRHRFVSVGYDLLNAVLWLPGGSDRLRRRFVDTLDLDPGDDVLELGCGTGLVTRHLGTAGAQVTAVDRAPHMLSTTRDRAPGATVVAADIGSVEIDGVFDWIVLAFVLHELTPPRRTAVLRRCIDWLGSDGKIAVLDWARPSGIVHGPLWAATVRAIEPPAALDVLDAGLDHAVGAAGLVVSADRRLAAGRARVVHLRPATSG